MVISNEIKRRFSPRIFSSQSIDLVTIDLLIEAARWSASSRNSQPWRFVIGQKGIDDSWNRIFSCLTEFNKQWALSAPFLILVLAQRIDPETNNIRRHAFYDVGLSIGNLTQQATSFGLYLRNMGGFSIEDAVKVFSIPTIYEPVVCLALGYPGNIFDPSEQFFVESGDDRQRRNRSQIIFNDNWDEML